MEHVEFIMKNKWTLITGVFLRLALVAAFLSMEFMAPFHRVLHKEEAWLYANPKTKSYFPTSMLWPMVMFLPPAVIGLVFIGGVFKSCSKGRVIDAMVAAWVVSLLMPLNGFVTNCIKVNL